MARPCSSSRQNKRPIKLSEDRKSTRLNSSHSQMSYAVSCLKKKHLLGEGAQRRAAGTPHLAAVEIVRLASAGPLVHSVEHLVPHPCLGPVLAGAALPSSQAP